MRVSRQLRPQRHLLKMIKDKGNYILTVSVRHGTHKSCGSTRSPLHKHSPFLAFIIPQKNTTPKEIKQT
jgi:hypothetical protein